MEQVNKNNLVNVDPMSISAAINHVEGVRGNIMGKYGNYDASEGRTLDDLISKLFKGEILPQEAIGKADALFESKNFR